jgi:hypothetical protein
MKRDTRQKSSPFLRKKTACLSGTFIHFWPFLVRYRFSINLKAFRKLPKRPRKPTKKPSEISKEPSDGNLFMIKITYLEKFGFKQNSYQNYLLAAQKFMI